SPYLDLQFVQPLHQHQVQQQFALGCFHQIAYIQTVYLQWLDAVTTALKCSRDLSPLVYKVPLLEMSKNMSVLLPVNDRLVHLYPTRQRELQLAHHHAVSLEILDLKLPPRRQQLKRRAC